MDNQDDRCNEFAIETDRLSIRDYREADLTHVHQFRSDPDAVIYMGFSPETVAESSKWLTGAIHHNRLVPRSAYNLAIARRSDDRAIGWIGFGNSERHPGVANFGVGYMIASQHWGNGYVPEALAAVVSFIFGTLGGQQITAWCYEDNRASARVLEKSGFAFVTDFVKDDTDVEPIRCLEYGIHFDSWHRSNSETAGQVERVDD